MKKIILIVGYLTFIFSTIKAQSVLPHAYEITTDTAKVQMLDSSLWQKLEDKEGKWTFEEVSKNPLSGKFHAPGVVVSGIDTTNVHTYWHRYSLKNNMTNDVKISLTSPVDYFDVYVLKEDSSVSHFRSGLLRNWNEKDGLRSAEWAGAIPLVLKPGEVITVYDRRNRIHDKNFRTTARYYNTEKLIKENYIDYTDSREYIYSKIQLQEAFMLGLLFLAIVFSIFLFRVTKEKVYIYFSLFGFFLGVNRTYNISEAYTNWYMPRWNWYVPLIGYAWIFIPFFLVLFIRNFFDTKLRYPKWNKTLIIISWLQLTVGLLDFIFRSVVMEQGTIVSLINAIVVFLIVPLAVFITSLLYIKSNVKTYRFIAVGAIPYVLFYIVFSFIGPESLVGDIAPHAISAFVTNNFRLFEMVSLTWLIICFTWVLFMRFDELKKENIQQSLDKERLEKEKVIERNELIAKQKTELEKQVADRTAELKTSLEELKSTQSQLIQSEKMASLGELTAGIAHEIQNPLNFVNNFSEVSVELTKEMVDEVDKGNTNEVKSIANDLVQNLEKINHHGKRADAIVKGMLQHSRASSGQKELTDINTLADEYLRLAYHGLRAKDKNFNAKFETNFDTSIPKINIAPQDIGRVILNLITNAFYAVNERQKAERLKQNAESYEPTVTVSTKKDSDKILIVVADNGNGIPEAIKEKIFQPFFTTKPAGQGTGLGLSLSYDIIKKAHTGDIYLESKEGEFTEFIIRLPL